LLANDEVTGSSITTTTLYSPSHIEWCARFAHGLIEASSMAALHGGAPAMACSPEHCYSFAVT
jgi:hypothetical protein